MPDKKKDEQEQQSQSVDQQSQPEEPEERQRPVAIVGIGSSAGGLEALTTFLDNLPGDTGLAFVVVSHQPSDNISMLPELLRKHSQMNLKQTSSGNSMRFSRCRMS